MRAIKLLTLLYICVRVMCAQPVNPPPGIIKGNPPGNDTLDLKTINGNTCRTLGAYIGWNTRLGQSGWVFGIHASVMWRLKNNYLINFETNDASRFTSGTMPFEPRMILGGFGYHF